MSRFAIPAQMLVVTVLLSLLSANVADAASSYLKRGQYYFKKGYITKAIGAFNRAAKQQPNSADAQAWLGMAYKKQGGSTNFAKATVALEKALTLNSNNINVKKALAELYSWDKKTRVQALELYQAILTEQPNDKAMQKAFSQTLIWQGEYEAALPYAEQVYSYASKDTNWLSSYALAQAQAGSAETAVELYEGPLAKKVVNDTGLKQSYTLALIKNGQNAKAMETYQDLKASIDSTKASPDTVSIMSGLAYELDLYNEAAAYDQQLPGEYVAGSKLVRQRMARTYAQLGESERAIETFADLYQEGQLSTDAELLEFADYLTSLKPLTANMADVAESLYIEALKASANKAPIQLRLARLYSQQAGQFQKTVSAYQSVLAFQDSPSVRQELVDYLKASAGTENVGPVFEQLAKTYPNDVPILSGYAEYLSWTEATRVESIRLYLQVAQLDSPAPWAESVEQVLSWHQPKQALMPLYTDVLSIYPDSFWAHLSIARAHWQDGYDFDVANAKYSELLASYPNESSLVGEYSEFLASAKKGDRTEAAQLLSALYDQYPSNQVVKVSYANLLTYTRQYEQAVGIFDEILATSPQDKGALIGKGHAMLWGGRKFGAKKVLEQAYSLYPNDKSVGLALIEAEKAIGRYDKAIKLMRELHARQMSSALPTDNAADEGFALELEVEQSTLPSLQALGDDLYTPVVDHGLSSLLTEANVQQQANSRQADLEAEMNRLESLMDSVQQAQLQAHESIQDVSQDLHFMKATRPSAMTPLTLGSSTGGPQGTLTGSQWGTHSASFAQQLQGEPSSTLTSTGSAAFNRELQRVEAELNAVMRPVFRSGFLYTTQDGDDTVNAMSHNAFSNMASFSLTPRVRVRGGYALRRFSLPDSPFSPSATTAHQYTIGSTMALADRLTFDGDLSLTQFDQSDSTNWTYQTKLIWDATDRIKLKAGLRRSPLETSLQSYTGLTPSFGSFANQLVGQVRENAAFIELNLGQWKNWDWTTAYEFAWIDGSNVADNTKNQAYSSLGYNWRYQEDHTARLSHQFLFMGFARQATNGFVDIATGGAGPVASLSPVSPALPGVSFGGYFSPDWFVLNAARLDLQGSFKERLFEYKLGGSLGIQAFDAGVPGESDPTTLATQIDATLITNLNDTLSLYGTAAFQDSGGLFNRFRIGGGLIVRPDIKAIAPLISY